MNKILVLFSLLFWTAFSANASNTSYIAENISTQKANKIFERYFQNGSPEKALNLLSQIHNQYSEENYVDLGKFLIGIISTAAKQSKFINQSDRVMNYVVLLLNEVLQSSPSFDWKIHSELMYSIAGILEQNLNNQNHAIVSGTALILLKNLAIENTRAAKIFSEILLQPEVTETFTTVYDFINEVNFPASIEKSSALYPRQKTYPLLMRNFIEVADSISIYNVLKNEFKRHKRSKQNLQHFMLTILTTLDVSQPLIVEQIYEIINQLIQFQLHHPEVPIPFVPYYLESLKEFDVSLLSDHARKLRLGIIRDLNDLLLGTTAEVDDTVQALIRANHERKFFTQNLGLLTKLVAKFDNSQDADSLIIGAELTRYFIRLNQTQPKSITARGKHSRVFNSFISSLRNKSAQNSEFHIMANQLLTISIFVNQTNCVELLSNFATDVDSVTE